MKKVISILLAICLTCAFGVSALATTTTRIDQDTDGLSGSTTVSTTVEPTYAVDIPATLTINFGSTANTALTVSAAAALDDFRIAAGKKVEVSVSTANGKFALTNLTHEIAYKVYSPGETAQNEVVAIFTEKGQSKTININVPNWTTALTAGPYSQSLIFTLNYTNVAP